MRAFAPRLNLPKPVEIQRAAHELEATAIYGWSVKRHIGSSLWINLSQPTHPGEILREEVFPSLGLTQLEFANRLGVSRRTVSELLHERRPVTPDMAIRLGRLLGNGPEIWLKMQQALDLLEVGRAPRYADIKPLELAT